MVIKPNIGWDRNVAQGANTHPSIVSTLVTLVLEAGAAKVMVFDRTCNEERRCYQNSGIKPALEALKDRRVSCSYVGPQICPRHHKAGSILEGMGLLQGCPGCGLLSQCARGKTSLVLSVRSIARSMTRPSNLMW